MKHWPRECCDTTRTGSSTTRTFRRRKTTNASSARTPGTARSSKQPKRGQPYTVLHVYSDSVFKLGRLAQPYGYWDCVCPNTTHRNTISREHFHILPVAAAAGESVSVYRLENKSANGVVLNGDFKERGFVHEIEHGDIIGFVSNLNDDCFLSLRFETRFQL